VGHRQQRLGRRDQVLLPRRSRAQRHDALPDLQPDGSVAEGVHHAYALVAADGGETGAAAVATPDGDQVGRVDRPVREADADLAGAGLGGGYVVEAEDLGGRAEGVVAEGTHEQGAGRKAEATPILTAGASGGSALRAGRRLGASRGPSARRPAG